MPLASMFAAQSHDPLLRNQVGRYEVLLPLGAGGMATVYLARALGVGGFQRLVALKLAHETLSSELDFTTSLLEEAKLVAHLHHRNIVSVLDVGEHQGRAYLVMEYLEGDTLAALARWHRSRGDTPPLPIALRILDDALRGLHAAHELRGEDGAPLELVHRDFSPQNILLGVDGSARLSDFGIAKIAHRIATTKEGMLKGNLSYAAPEQVRGLALDRRCDVWAAGVVAWELVAGRPLFPAAQDEAATLMRIVSEVPPRVRSVRPSVPRALEEAIAMALVTSVEHRSATAEEFRTALLAAWGRPLADASEVAEHVERVAGPKLNERRENVHRASFAPVVTTDDSISQHTATVNATSRVAPAHRAAARALWIATPAVLVAAALAAAPYRRAAAPLASPSVVGSNTSAAGAAVPPLPTRPAAPLSDDPKRCAPDVSDAPALPRPAPKRSVHDPRTAPGSAPVVQSPPPLPVDPLLTESP